MKVGDIIRHRWDGEAPITTIIYIDEDEKTPFSCKNDPAVYVLRKPSPTYHRVDRDFLRENPLPEKYLGKHVGRATLSYFLDNYEVVCEAGLKKSKVSKARKGPGFEFL